MHNKSFRVKRTCNITCKQFHVYLIWWELTVRQWFLLRWRSWGAVILLLCSCHLTIKNYQQTASVLSKMKYFDSFRRAVLKSLTTFERLLCRVQWKYWKKCISINEFEDFPKKVINCKTCFWANKRTSMCEIILFMGLATESVIFSRGTFHCKVLDSFLLEHNWLVK